MGETYAAAGVSIEAGDEAVRRLAPLARSTFRPEVLGDIGGVRLARRRAVRYREPVLVSSTDGVGTKLLVAEADRPLRHDRHRPGGDVRRRRRRARAPSRSSSSTTSPSARLDPTVIEALVAGVAEGCRQAGCALVGGEMAEHPAMDARRLRPGRLRGGRRRARRAHHRRAVRPGDVADRAALAGPALERLLAGAAGAARRRRPGSTTRPGRARARTLADELLAAVA